MQGSPRTFAVLQCASPCLPSFVIALPLRSSDGCILIRARACAPLAPQTRHNGSQQGVSAGRINAGPCWLSLSQRCRTAGRWLLLLASKAASDTG